MKKFDTGTLLTGIFFLFVGAVFVLEALGAWTFRVGDLRLLGPAALVFVGLGVMVSAVARDG